MAIQIQLRQGTTTENNTFKGALGELTYDTEKKQLRVHDGSTVGGTVVDDTTRNVTSQVSNATETVAGKAKIATTAIAQAGVNDTDFLTPLKTIPLIGGVGQAYKDVKATRALGTTYTNPNTKPIWIYVDSVRGSNSGFNFRVTITPTSGTSVTWLTQLISTQYICQGCTGWVMIPPKASYLIGFGDSTYVQVNTWLEIS